MNWKKLSAFAPMLAVIVLAGCMGKTLADIRRPLTKPKQKKSHSRKKQHKAQKKKDSKRPK